MKRIYKLSALVGLSLIGLSACNSGLNTGLSGTTTSLNDGLTTVTGTVELADGSSTTQFLKSLSSGCAADELIATDSSGDQTTTPIQAEDCSFEISLPSDESYNFGFFVNNELMANMVFSSGTNGFSQSSLPLQGVRGALNLGRILMEGSQAVPDFNPLRSLDFDQDGLNDFADLDDDDDGIADELEEDCDLDGVRDDYDGSCACRGQRGGTRHGDILEMRPSRQGDHRAQVIPLDERVRVRLACVADETTISSETFSVISDDDAHQITCDYEVRTLGDSGNSQIICHHDEDLFVPDTTYTVTMDGVLCDDGNAAESLTFQMNVFAHPRHGDLLGQGDREDEIETHQSDDEDENELNDDSDDESSDDQSDDLDEGEEDDDSF